MRGVIAFLLVLALAAVSPAAAAASEYRLEVTSPADRALSETHGEEACGEFEAACTLRAALETVKTDANHAGFPAEEVVIVLPAGEYIESHGSLVLGSTGEFCQGHPCRIRIRGAGPGLTIISGEAAGSVIQSLEGAKGSMTIEGVMLTGGYGDFGGGVEVHGGAGMTLRDDYVFGNQAKLKGGGVATLDGPLTISESLIEDNGAGEGGGLSAEYTTSPVKVLDSSIYRNVASNGGAISSYKGSVELVDSTITGNSAEDKGGAASMSEGARLVAAWSTIANNKAGFVGGIYGASGSKEPILALIEDSILSGDPPEECGGTAIVQTIGKNIVYGSCPYVGDPAITTDPLLGEVMSSNPFMGGPAATGGPLYSVLPLLHGSPAVNAVPCRPRTDQRGTARPQGPACDIGAIEAAADAAASVSASPSSPAPGSTITITAAVTDDGTEHVEGASVSLALPQGADLISAPAGCTASFGAATTLSCQAGTIEPGHTRPFAVLVSLPSQGAATISASVTSTNADFNADDDNASATVNVQQPPPAKQPSPSALFVAATSALASNTIAVDAHGRAAIRLTCAGTASEPCRDALGLFPTAGKAPASIARSRTSLPFAHTRTALAPGASKFIYLQLPRAELRVLRSRRRLPARLLLSVHRTSGQTVSHLYRVTLVAPRR